MNDAKPTCGLNESKPTILYSTCEQWLFGYKTSKEVVKFDLPIKVSKGSTFSFSEGSVPVLSENRDGTEPLTAEWLIEKWVSSTQAEHTGTIYFVHTNEQGRILLHIMITIDGIIYVNRLKIATPPKTRDEFRSFAKWFGLEEK